MRSRSKILISMASTSVKFFDSEPMSQMPRLPLHQTAADEAVPPVPRLRILFVEDHTDSRRVIANLLSHCGYDVSVADAAGAALELLNTNQFDVMLSDIGLPDG